MPKRLSSSAAMLENQAGELLIVKANYKSYWTLPGGIIDQRETPKEAAVREIQEEVGLRIKADDLMFVAVVDRISSEAHTYQFLFKTMLKQGVDNSITLQQSEIEAYAFVSKQQVLSGDRPYAQAIYHWAHGRSGYIEQVFEKGKE